MRRLLFLALTTVAGCGPPSASEPAVPKLSGVELARRCTEWTDEPPRLSLDREHKTEAIFAGPDYGCATVDGGRVVCWGWNEGGSLVGGDREFVDEPAFVRGVRNIAQVENRCVRTDHGTVYCWDAGPLDAGGRRLISDYLPPLQRARLRKARAPCGPVRVPDIEDAVDLTVGEGHACALTTSGRVHCWGDNSRAQLARMTAVAEDGAMPKPIPWLRGVRSVAAGRNHTCALLRGGKVACWGDNELGQLGIEGPRFSGRPQWVPDVSRVSEISAGEDRTCARHRDGSLTCWGEVGLSQGDDRATPGVCPPVAVPTIEDAVEVSSGGIDCARRRNGKVVCWRELDCGFGESSGEWGSGRNVWMELERVVEVSAGSEHACARMRDGSLRCWGEARTGGLGSHAPELATTSELESVPKLRGLIGSGRDTLCGLDRKRRLRCSELSRSGNHQPAQPKQGVDGPVIELIQAPLLDCARTKDGRVSCWGTEGNTLPVAELEQADHIYPLWSSAACAHQADGQTLCWGAEVTSLHTTDDDETTEEVDYAHWHAEPIDTPVEVRNVVLDRNAVCGLTPAGKVTCWGLAASEDPLTFSRMDWSPEATADDETTTDAVADKTETEETDGEDETGEPAPDRTVVEVEVANVVDIMAASDGFCARTETGEVLCWQARFEDHQEPIQPIPVRELVGVHDWGHGAASTELCAVTGDDNVRCFAPGYDPDNPPERIETTAVEVEGATALLRLAGHPCVTRTDRSLYCWGGPFRGVPLSQDEALFVTTPVEIAGLGSR